MPAAALSLWEDFEVPPQARRGQITLNLYDHLAAYVPKRPGAYLRISHDRFGLEAGVDRQLEDTNDARRRLRWPDFAQVYKENDTSAFKKRKVVRPDGTIDWVVLRPQFRRLLADLASGVIDGVIFYDLDRLVRRPRDLEDLIDIVEYVKRPVLGATGGHMNLINDSDRHMARIMCVMALKSSEDTSRRAARMHLSCAQDGKIQGRIAYGWVRKGPTKGKLLQGEAEVVQHIFRQCLTGETAYGIATQLNRDGVKPPGGQALVLDHGHQDAPQPSVLRHGLLRRPTPRRSGLGVRRMVTRPLRRRGPAPARLLGTGHRAAGLVAGPVRAATAPPEAWAAPGEAASCRSSEARADWSADLRQVHSRTGQLAEDEELRPQLPVPSAGLWRLRRHQHRCGCDRDRSVSGIRSLSYEAVP